MSNNLRIALVGDYDPAVLAHKAIPIAIQLASEHRQIEIEGRCIQTSEIDDASRTLLLGLAEADHTETNSEAKLPLITALACSLVEKEGELTLERDSILFRSYGSGRVHEGYRCTYGPDPAYERTLFGGDFRVDPPVDNGEVREAELHGHPFYVGTLFQPERRALKAELPPLVSEFIGGSLREASNNHGPI